MKKVYLILGLIGLTLVTGCDTEIDRAQVSQAVAPVVSATPVAPSVIVLQEETAENIMLKLNWSATKYLNESVAGSVIGKYTLQIDDTAEFTDPEEINAGDALTYQFKGKDLNRLLIEMNFATETAHQVYFRIKSTFFLEADVTYSAVSQFTITPYSTYIPPVIPVPAQLYLASGSAVEGGWLNPIPDSRKFTQISDTQFELIINLYANSNYELITSADTGNYTPVYRLAPGVTPSAVVYGGTFVADGNGYPLNWSSQGILTPPTDGLYKITFNFQDATYTVVAQ